jgi:ankyrin repeat protein
VGCTCYLFHSGSRYNALHIACRVGNINVVRRVLELINDHNFIGQLQPANTPNRDAMNAGLFNCLFSNINSFTEIRYKLIDYYLNTPDKTASRTPLWYAVDRAHLDIVRLLCTYEQLNRNCVDM